MAILRLQLQAVWSYALLPSLSNIWEQPPSFHTCEPDQTFLMEQIVPLNRDYEINFYLWMFGAESSDSIIRKCISNCFE